MTSTAVLQFSTVFQRDKRTHKCNMEVTNWKVSVLK